MIHKSWFSFLIQYDKEEEIIDEGDSDEDVDYGKQDSELSDGKEDSEWRLLFDNGDSNQTSSQRSICENNCG